MLHFDPTFSASYLVALMMGLFSALHCFGMCGSIIGTLTLSLKPAIREQKSLLWPFVLSYNLGRITSYTLAGFLAGLLGHVLSLPFGYGEGHRVLQIVSALIMAGAGLHIGGWFPRFAYIEKAGGLLWRRIEPYGRRLLPVETLPRAFVFGMVWGWLPCGLVYAALALAATSGHVPPGGGEAVQLAATGGHVLHSGLTMLAFGMGTLPAVMAVGIMTTWMVRLSRLRKFRCAVGITMILLALMAAFPMLNPFVLHPMTH
jgi:sulfite exporter TauE/SafE